MKCLHCDFVVRDKLKSGAPRNERYVIDELRQHVKYNHPEVEQYLKQVLGDMRFSERQARNVGTPNSCSLCGEFNGHYGQVCPQAPLSPAPKPSLPNRRD